MAEDSSSSNGMSQADLDALINGGDKGPPYNPKKEADLLVEDIALYLEERTPFPAGSILRQRLGLCARARQFHAIAYGFVKYLEPAEVVAVKFPEYHNLDCVVAVTDSEGDAHFVLADSRRYEIYPPAELEELAAKAVRAIN